MASTYDEYQKLLTQNRIDLGQRMADYPRTEENLRANIFGQDKTLSSMRSNQAQQIQQLYEADKRLADRYANPQSEAYMTDPYAREKARAIQSQASAGQITDIGNQINTRKDVLGDTLDKSLKLILYGIEAKKLENQMLQGEMDNMFKQQQLSGTADEPLSIDEVIKLNASGYKVSYGTTKKQAMAMGIVPSADANLSSTERQKQQTWNSIVQQVQTIEPIMTAAKGGMGFVSGNLSKIPYFNQIFPDQNIRDLQPQLATLEANLVNALARSGYSAGASEVRRQFIPSLTDSYDDAVAKLNALKGLASGYTSGVATTNQPAQQNPLQNMPGFQPPSYFIPDTNQGIDLGYGG